MERKFYSKI